MQSPQGRRLFTDQDRDAKIASILGVLTEDHLFSLCKQVGCEVRESGRDKGKLSRLLVLRARDRVPELLQEFARDDLRRACQLCGLDSELRSRSELQNQLLAHLGLAVREGADGASDNRDGLPSKGQVVHARHRQWLVDEVLPAKDLGDSALVRLVCLDDDEPGRHLDMLWDLELGARIAAPRTQGLGDVTKLDPPAHFGAYLHALKWSAVSAADATRFQAPFRAGIMIKNHQLTPLMKALELPRANLFIADDVGLGKTIEAGLVLQELLLRQQVNFVLVVCPASVCLQWQGEMQRRFGLRFEVMTREFVAYRREDRGFGVNPWSTHNRFIVSHALLRRSDYLDPLLQHLGEGEKRARKGLLILDEAHAAAPASASKYAVDTDITRTLRDLAPRFDHRLFLSATPHNGHSNSFSALLEILDPVRFTRGVHVDGKLDLAPIMVRRLKRDLRLIGNENFPTRLLVQIALRNDNNAWFEDVTTYDAETGKQSHGDKRELASGPPTELILAEKLRRYTELCAPTSGRGKFPFIMLQQRLLSSPEAFAHTLNAHIQGLSKLLATPVKALKQQTLSLALESDPETHGVSDDTLVEELQSEVRAKSVDLPSPTEEAKTLLTEMQSLAERARREPDAKVQALLRWIRENMCPAVGLPENTREKRKWNDRRVILFTEYGDTKRYLIDLLTAAIAHTDDADHRILPFHGGMGDDARAEVQAAFNSPPDQHPVRILVATDAAREGVNLQAHCADLFHVDIPWNPSRLEQRNGRIDRTLQPEKEVRCHYFLYPDRVEDRVLETVLRKVDTIARELGSLGVVLLEQIESTLQHGITAKMVPSVERIGSDAKTTNVDAELEASRNIDDVRAEIEEAGRMLERSKKSLEVAPESLRGVIDIGLQLAGAAPMKPARKTSDDKPTFELPTLERSWDKTLDTLRPPRKRDEAFWQWRQQAPRPVTFHPLTRLDEPVEQLHLAHPFVKRILDRFSAQGFGAHDLSRVTVLVAPEESVTRVIAYARLTLFGPEAVRLHDELVAVAGPWSGKASEVVPYKDKATLLKTVTTTEHLLAAGAKAPNAKIQSHVRDNANDLFHALWPTLEAEADSLATDARKGLQKRADTESSAMRALLVRQQGAIEKANAHLRQLSFVDTVDKDQKRQVELDLDHLKKRKEAAATELETEPRLIRELYEVRMTRITPVGLVVAYAGGMT